MQPLVIPSCAVGAPHRRDRIWFVANRANTRIESMQEQKNEIHKFKHVTNPKKFRQERYWNAWNRRIRLTNNNCKVVPDTAKKRCKIRSKNKTEQHLQNNWFTTFPSQSAVCSRNDGFPTGLDGITFQKWRQESIKAYGNAIVPQVAYEIIKKIVQVSEKNR